MSMALGLGFHLSRMTVSNNQSVKFAIIQVLPFLNSPKDLNAEI